MSSSTSLEFFPQQPIDGEMMPPPPPPPVVAIIDRVLEAQLLEKIKMEYDNIDKLSSVSMRGFSGDPNAHFIFQAKLTQETSSKPYCFPVQLANPNTRSINWDVLLDENYKEQLLKNFCFFQGAMNDESPATVMRCLRHSTCNAVREEIAQRGLVALYHNVLEIQKVRKARKTKAADMEQTPRIKLFYFPEVTNLSFTNCVMLANQDLESEEAFYFMLKQPLLAKKTYNLPFLGELGDRVVFAYDSDFLLQPRNFDMEPTYFGGSRMHIEANRTLAHGNSTLGKLEVRQFDVSPLDVNSFCFLTIESIQDWPKLATLLNVMTIAQGGNACELAQPIQVPNMISQKFFFDRSNISPTFVEDLKKAVATYAADERYVFNVKHSELISFSPTVVKVTNFSNKCALVNAEFEISGEMASPVLAQLQRFFVECLKFDGKLSQFEFKQLSCENFELKCTILGLNIDHIKQIIEDDAPFFSLLSFN